MNLGNQRVIDFAKEAQKLGFSTETRVVIGVVGESKDGVHGIVFREWAENATALSLVGDFNNWNKEANPAVPLSNRVFEVWLPDQEGKSRIPHLSKGKVLLQCQDGTQVYRVPSHIHCAVPDPISKDTYVGVYWDFEKHDYDYKVKTRQSPLILNRTGLRWILFCTFTRSIYECHIGLSGEEPKVSSYSSFLTTVLPRIVRDGYNCVFFVGSHKQ